MDFTFHSTYIYGIPERFDHFLLPDSRLSKPFTLYNWEIYCSKLGTKESMYGTVPNLIVPGKSG